MKHYLVALLLLAGTVAFYAAPPHRQAIAGSVAWWTSWAAAAQTSWLPGERGLNVAVLDSTGRLLEAKAFDTYIKADSGFPAFIAELPADAWVVVAAKDDAATSLSEADLAALKSLGGTGSLTGRIHWAYVLVGRPGLGLANGFERLDPGPLDLVLAPGELIGDAALPTGLRLRSAGFDSGDFATAGPNPTRYADLRQWLITVLERM